MLRHVSLVSSSRCKSHVQCKPTDASPDRNIDKPPLRGGFIFLAAAGAVEEEDGVLMPPALPALPKLREGPETALAHAGASAFCFSGVLKPLTLRLAAGGHVRACPQADALLTEAVAAAADGGDSPAAVDSA